VYFLGNSSDPWYSATKPSGRTAHLSTGEGSRDGDETVEFPVFQQSEAATPMGCTMREQYCNSHFPWGNCTILGSINDIYDQAGLGKEGINYEQADRLQWSIDTMWEFSPNLAVLPRTLGGQALKSRDGLAQGFQSPIPNDQWQQDVQYWFDTALATMQASFVVGATGPLDPLVLQFATYPNSTEQRSVCHSQVGANLHRAKSAS
jgi:hypothetical protein